MKKSKLFAKIIYYVFTFSIGILLALFLPYILFLDNSDAIKIVGEDLDKGNYAEAMKMVGGYFNQQPVYQTDFDDGGGLVLFEAAVLVPSEPVGDTPVGDKLGKAYAGFLYGVGKTYKFNGYGVNQSKIVVTDGADQTYSINALNLDTNDDKVSDTTATFLEKGYLYLDILQQNSSSVKSITFLDRDGEVFKQVNVNLNFSGSIFTDVEELISGYNSYVDEYAANHTEANKEHLKSLEEGLRNLESQFFAKNPDYARSSSNVNESVAHSKADKAAAWIVVAYFVVIYIIGDLLVGQHYIIKFFRWFLFKVCKIKRKSRPAKNTEVFGHDYFSQVTFVLDVSDFDGFSESVQIRYTTESGDGEAISFILLKEQNYTATQRIKAGTYVNMWIDLDKTKYATQNLPETLVVEGYQKAFKIKIIKREG